MASHGEQLQRIFSRYQTEKHSGPAMLDDVYTWARKEGLWEPREENIRAQFKEEMAQALREEYRTDETGRRYRAKHAVRMKFAGKQTSFWGDIDRDPRDYMATAFAQKRRHIAGECHQVKIDVDHFNETHPDEEPIQLSLNFEEDVTERLIEEGLADAA
jgi:hypothetical protein